MRKAAVIGGGAAGMMTAVLAAGERQRFISMKKMKSWERSCLSQERAAAM